MLAESSFAETVMPAAPENAPAESGGTSIPCIARIAGTLATVLDGFGSPASLEKVALLNRVEETLTSRRAQAVEALFACLSKGEPEQRRFLLTLKRNCFNGRPVAKFRTKEHWETANRWTDGALSEVAKLEIQAQELQTALENTYSEERDRERAWLLQQANDPTLMRGIALASLSLAESLGRSPKSPQRKSRRKQRRLERSFIRYLSRAALKLSPYSTLTPVALATASDSTLDDPESPPLRYLEGSRSSRSLVRVKRYLLDQCCTLLFRHPGVLANLPVALNNSLECLREGRYRFLRPLHLHEQAGDLEFSKPAQVTATFSGPLLPFLTELLQTSLPYRRLVAILVDKFGQGDPEDQNKIERLLGKLLKMGLLSVEAPWPGFDPYLEVNLLSFLTGLPEEDQVSPEIIELLSELVHLEQRFADTSEPAVSVRRIEALVPRLFATIRDSIEPKSDLRFEKEDSRNYYEDVFEVSRRSKNNILKLDRSALAPINRVGYLWWQVCSLFEPRYEMKFALAHLLEEERPGQRRIPLLELFALARPTWEQFQSFLLHDHKNLFDLFNPFDLKEAEELKQLRLSVFGSLRSSIEVDGSTERIPTDRLESLVASIPSKFRSPVGPCLFVQPGDIDQNVWILNNIFEGTGRMSTRFGSAMPEGVLDRYLRHYRQRSIVERGGASVELLDMLYTKANTVNVHWPQTQKTLLSTGESSALPADRELRLTNLWVERIGPEGLRLVDADGKEHLPCLMSPVQLAAVPTILKFLDLFGTNTRAMKWLGLGIQKTNIPKEDSFLLNRQMIGNLVIRRRRWILKSDDLPQVSGVAARDFQKLQNWRSQFGLPKEIYLIEKVGDTKHGRDIFKPQYFDLESPLFVELFNEAIRSEGEQVTLVEAMPGRDSFPEDPSLGGPRACEVMLEWLAFQPASSALE